MKINETKLPGFLRRSFLLLLGGILWTGLLSSGAWAQWGIKGGPAISGFKPTHSDNRYLSGEDLRPFLGYEVDWIQHGSYYPVLDFQIGATYSVRLSKSFALQPELYYARRGYQLGYKELYDTLYCLNTTYIQLPLLLQARLPVDWAVRPYLLLGPYIAVNLSAERTLNILETKDTKSLPNMKRFDFGLVVALGGEFSAWSRSLALEMRLNWGLAGVMDQFEDSLELWDDPGKLQVVSLNLLLSFRF